MAKEKPITRTSSFSDHEIPQTGGNKDPKPEDLVDLLKVKDEFTRVRIIGPVEKRIIGWIKIKGKNSKKKVRVPRVAPDGENPYETLDDVQWGVHFFCNVIVRDLSKKVKHTKAEVKEGHLLKAGGDSPVKVLRVPASVARTLKEVSQTTGHDIGDPDNGCDVSFKFDSTAPAASMWSVVKGDKSPLSKKEKQYLLWPVHKLWPMPSVKEAKADAKDLAKSQSKKKKSD